MAGFLKSLVFQEAPYDSLVFIIIATAYVVFVAYRYFPSDGPQPKIYAKRNAFVRYVTVAAWLGLYLPVLYILSPLAFHPPSFSWALFAAGPHLLLLLAQVVSERVSFSSASMVVRALIPPLYNARRLFTLYEWIAEQSKAIESSGPGTNPLFMWWLIFGVILAVANLVFWSYNLFGFLLPVYVPDSIRLHYLLYPTASREDSITLHDEVVKTGVTDFSNKGVKKTD